MRGMVAPFIGSRAEFWFEGRTQNRLRPRVPTVWLLGLVRSSIPDVKSDLEARNMMKIDEVCACKMSFRQDAWIIMDISSCKLCSFYNPLLNIWCDLEDINYQMLLDLEHDRLIEQKC